MPFSVVAQVRPPGLIQNIEYSRVDGQSLLMDANLPASAVPTPAAILVHGGGWVTGDRRVSVRPLFKPLTDAGFAWFSISYRLATNITQFGVAIDDVENAIHYVKDHAREFNIDPNRIALIGESAGGQLALMAALRGDPDMSVNAIVAFYTPTNLVDLAKNSSYIPPQIKKSVQGTPFESFILAGLAQFSPIQNVKSGMPPVLFIHGTSDPLVPFAQSVDMCQQMKRVGASCDVYPVQGAGHGMQWWNTDAPYKQKMIGWLQAKLAVSTAFAS